MFKKYPAHSAFFFAPMDPGETGAKVAPEEYRTFGAQAIYDMVGAAAVIVVELSAGSFQKAVMVKQLQPPQELLWTPGNERTNMGGTHKTKPLDEPDDFSVALGEPDGDNWGDAFKAGKTG